MSLEHLSGEVSKELLEPLEPFYDVDEKEAEEINSCLNFLSILDDEDSTDSCNFTLFRKKDNQRETENNDKTCKSIENSSSSNNNNNNGASSSGKIVSAKTHAKSDIPEIDLTKSSGERSAVLKIGNSSTILVPASKTDSSFIKGKNNIILKIPSITLKNCPIGQKDLLQSDKSNRSRNINCTEFKVFKKVKLKNTSSAEFKPKSLPKCLEKTLESAKEGEILLRNQIFLPSVSAARKSISPVKKSSTVKSLQTFVSPNKPYAIENSKMVHNKRNSRKSSVSQLPNILGKVISVNNDKKKGEILKNWNLSLNKESENDVMFIPTNENKVNISKNSREVPHTQNLVDITKFQLEIPHSESENSTNSPENLVKIPPEFETTLNIPKLPVEIPQSDVEDTRNTEKNSVEVSQIEFDNTVNSFNRLVEVSHQEIGSKPNITKHSVEIPCPNFEDTAIIYENPIEDQLQCQEILQENSVEFSCPSFDDTAIIQKKSVEIPHTEFENIVTPQEGLKSAPSEFENVALTQKDFTLFLPPECEDTLSTPKNLIDSLSSESCKFVNYFNSFSSVEITQSSAQEIQKDTQQIVNDNVEKIKRTRKKKSEKTNKNKKNADTSKKSKTNTKISKTKPVPKEIYKPLERMGLPTFLSHNNLQGKKVSIEDAVAETSGRRSLKLSAKEPDIDKVGSSLDETSLTSSLNSDHTSDSLFILTDNHPDPNNKGGSSEMIDKLHNYCHSPRVTNNERSVNNSGSLESKEYESISSDIVNNYSDKDDQLFVQPLDNSHFDENMFPIANETPYVMSEPEMPTVNFTEISKTLVTNQDLKDKVVANEELGSFETSDLSKTGEKREAPDKTSFSYEEKGETPEKISFTYSFNKLSPLSFTIQNVLENMFKYEPFPSSANMARLAKVLGIQWRDIRNWFVARRTLSKKNGLSFRFKALTVCPWCPDAKDIGKDKAIVHLLSKGHILNMVPAIERHDNIFSRVQQGLYSNENHAELLTESSGIRIDETKERTFKKTLISPTGTHKIYEKHKARIDNINLNNAKEPVPIKDKTISKSSLFENKTKPLDYFKAKDVDALPVKGRESYIDIDNLKVDKSIDFKVHYDSSYVIGYRCPDCMKIFNTEWMLIKHSLLHKKFICSECQEVFSKEEELKFHFKEHLIDSMDDDLYRYYVCFKCYNLNCICPPDICRVPYFGGKHYIRPQKARRSKPFRSLPYSGVNEHLKVTLQDFWNKYKQKQSLRNFESESEKQDKSSTKSDLKNKKNICKPSYSVPTYTNITTFNCNLCESFFFTHDELEEHLAVHKIQANNKRRKKFQDEERKKKMKVRDTPVDKKSVCYYCNKSFKIHNLLVKHLKFFCKSLPLVLQSKLKNSIQIERVGKSKKFKLREEQILLGNKNSAKSLGAEESNLNERHLPCNKLNCDKRICGEHSNKKFLDKELQSEDSVMDDEFLETREEDLYLCKFCDIPLESRKLILLHIGRSCSKAPSEVVDEVHRMNYYHLTDEDHTKFSKLINRDDFHKILPLDKIKEMLDIETFLTAKGHKKRFKCKFCEKLPLKYWLKLHLTKHCKYVPKELHYAINRNSSRIFSSSKYNKKSSKETGKLKDTTSLINGNVEGDAKVQQTVTETCRSKLQSFNPKMPSSNLFYDCHLCEEKFKISKDFITHMQNFHCMNISEKSCYKWLTKVEEICNDVDLEKISTDNSPDQQQEEDTPYQHQDDNLIAYEYISSEIIEEPVTENDLDKEVTIASLANGPSEEVTVLSDDPSEEVIILPLTEETNVSNTALTVTPSKSRELDEELLSDDFEQFGSFFETVQLEDSAFGSASS